MKNRLTLVLILTIFLLISCLVWQLPFILPETEEHNGQRLDQLFFIDSELSPYYEVNFSLEDSDVPQILHRGLETNIKYFNTSNGLGYLGQYIFRFRNATAAVYRQKSIRDYYIFSEETIEKITYSSPYADFWWNQCASITQGFYCAVLARYGEIIIVTAFSYDNSLPSSYINQIVEDFDTRAFYLLKK